jgi:hypothetical protein
MLGAIVAQQSDNKAERSSEKAGDAYVPWHTSVPNRCVSWHALYCKYEKYSQALRLTVINCDGTWSRVVTTGTAYKLREWSE